MGEFDLAKITAVKNYYTIHKKHCGQAKYLVKIISNGNVCCAVFCFLL
jgi:hypothetical protein